MLKTLSKFLAYVIRLSDRAQNKLITYLQILEFPSRLKIQNWCKLALDLISDNFYS